MNSNYGKTGNSFNTFDFDLGLGSNKSRPLNDQKNKPNSNSTYTYTSSSFSQPKPGNTTPSWQPGKPSWTHQPAPGHAGSARSELGGPASMVGDIFGKSWGSATPGPARGAGPSPGIGIVNKNPNLFGDLVNSALGQNKSGGGSAPLKSATPAKGSFSMGGMADSLPKSSSSGSGGGWGSSGYGGVGNGVGGLGNNSNNNVNKSSSFGGYGNSGMSTSLNLGGTSMKGVGIGGGGGGVGMSSNKDPFGSLADFGSKPKPMGSTGIGGKPAGKAGSATSDDFAFGDFQNASKPSGASGFSSGSGNPLGSSSGTVPKMGGFANQNAQTPAQATMGADSFDMFFPSSTSSAAGVAGNAASNGAGGREEFSGGDDWGMESGFGGGHDGGSTTEIEGLPPPPPGVSASSAKTKGLDNYRQGQYGDAIKWLSWAEVLLEKAGDTAGTMEVLSCRASCYKEAGEYKKAVADCTKVLNHDDKNVAVLVQRALLYESMEKYRLGADDLRTVMKLDPGNRVARSTIHRLNKMAD